jgi:O-antigen/teichoic acid export membrane protein
MRINNVFKKIFINTSSQIIAKAVTVVLGFLTISLLTRYLGVAQYGIYNLVFAYLAFFGIFADFGLRLTLVRDLSGDIKSSNNLKSIYFSLKVIFTVVSIVLSLIALIFFPYTQTIKMAILVGSLAVGVGQMNAYGASVLQSKVKLDLVALLEVINRVATVIAIVIFVLLHWGLYAIILSVLIGNVVSTLLNIYLAPDFYHFTSIPSLDLIKKVVKASFPVGITSLLAVLYFKVDTMMLSVMKSPVDVGIYSLSYKLFENIIMLWAFYMASVYPLMAGYIQKDDQKNLKLILKTSIIVLVIFVLVALSIGFISAPLAIDILGGRSFTESILPFRILLVSLPFVFVNSIFYYLFLSFSKVKLILWVLLISLVVNFFVNLFLIPRYGYIGTSASTVATELLVSLLYFTLILKNRLFRFQTAPNHL